MTAKLRGIQLFGVNGRTGRYAWPPFASRDLAFATRLAASPPQLLAAARRKQGELEAGTFTALLGSAPGLPARGGRTRAPDLDLPEWEIARRGWGVVFPAGDKRTEAIREALAPLLAWRKAQVGAVSKRHFRELVYLSGETLFDFRRRHRASAGIAEPHKIPGYLLLVGGPEAIPFDFQAELAALDHPVGRIDFESLDDFARYAESVVRAETAAAPTEARRVAFFAPEHPDDPLSEESATRLAAPLADACAMPLDGWSVERILGERATKSRLAGLLARPEPPSILFTAGHGAIFESGDDRQAAHQGALVCADWGGPKAAEISEANYFAADDLGSSARLGGLIAFHFACCSLGVPAQNELYLAGLPIPASLAPQDLAARLPQRMLAQGALAAIGHLDLVFAYSFRDGQSDGAECIDPPPLYAECLRSLLGGLPVGEAVSPFRSCYRVRLVERDELVRRSLDRQKVSAEDLWEVEAACHDAKYYAIFGDPAVRLTPAAETSR